MSKGAMALPSVQGQAQPETHERVGPGASLPLVRLGGGGGEACQILPLGAQHLHGQRATVESGAHY